MSDDPTPLIIITLFLLWLSLAFLGIGASFYRDNVRYDAVEGLIETPEFSLHKTASMGCMGGIQITLPVTDIYDVTWLHNGHKEYKAKIAVNYKTKKATFICDDPTEFACKIVREMD